MLRANNFIKAALITVFVNPSILNMTLGSGYGLSVALGQQQPPPAVQWISDYTYEDDRSESGNYYDVWFDADIPAYRTQPMLDPDYGGEQSREESGEDWHYCHANVIENDAIVGYVTSGYASWPNCWWDGPNYCTKPIPTESTGPGDFAPRLDELETIAHRKGDTRGTVARFDLNGHEVWYRHLFPGQIWGVIQASDGNFVVAGVSYTPMWPTDIAEPGPNPEFDDVTVIRLNDDPTIDMNTVPCSSFPNDRFRNMGYLCKLAPDGDILWCTMFNIGNDLVPALQHFSELHDVVERPGVNGPEYWVVGMADSDAQEWPPKPFMARVSQDGVKLSAFYYGGPGVNGLPSEWFTANKGLFTSIAIDPVSQAMLLSGWYEDPATGGLRAFATLVDPALSPVPYLPQWILDAGAVGGVLDVQAGYDPTKVSVATGGGFIPGSNGTRIVLPITANFEMGSGYSGQKIATLFVHGLDMDGTIMWSRNLGEVRAYDLQSDMTFLSDGNVAVVSSKWVEMDENQDSFVNTDDLPAQAVACLTDNFTTAPGVSVNWDATNLYNYWNTDAYVAKLNPADGTVIWDVTWDADPTSTFECTETDLRNQECMYKITEAEDGGLVLSGNTSHNFDDYYLVKLKNDCQSNIDYDDVVEEALSSDTHTYTVGVDEQWTADKNIVGIITIPDDHTLTITGCTIRFADSEQLAWPTYIVIEEGGTLNLENATLTSIDICPNSTWDGVLVQGDESASQLWQSGGVQQGTLNMRSSIISNARMGAVVANEFFNPPLAPQPGARSGGIINAYDSQFINNGYDVAFSPYENHGVILTEEIWPNLSIFSRCTFGTLGDLPVQGDMPEKHIFMSGVRRIAFVGCTWINNLMASEPFELPSDLGEGIESINSTFVVADHCANPLDPNGGCDPADITQSAFINLHRGITATTFDPSRTFSVDHATFSGTHYSIRMEGIQDASITRCDFDVPQPSIPGILGPVYAVYMDQCTGYCVQENAFHTQQPGGDNKKIGLVIKDSGKAYNTFYNNSFDNLYAAGIIEGVNAGADDAIGLEVKCNDFGLIDANTFDVALTGATVRIQKTQGQPLDQQDPNTYGNPAGNRFSVDHTGSGDPEEDWHVQSSATVVEYFHHIASPGNRTKPDNADIPDEIIPNEQPVAWPEKQVACPSQIIDGGTREEKRQIAEGEHEEYETSKDAYDATKDDGDTYSLLGYASDPSKSSSQVRNALQSVAPNVSTEVWQAAFERDPPMSAWHIAQALLSNSPLQSEVLLMVDDYGLPSSYAALVHAAQNGVNILTQLEAEIAHHGGNKGEALSALGRLSWLDSLHLGESLDSLRHFHESLPADNHALAIGGVLAAQGDYSALEALALAEESASDTPERYSVLRHFAELEQQQGWALADEALRAWLTNLGQQRDVEGSAGANAWLHALGEELPDEVIILPETGPKSASRSRQVQPVQWPTENLLEVFPNPARQVAYAAFELASQEGIASLQVADLHGRVLRSQVLNIAHGIVPIDLSGLIAGIYLLELLHTSAPSQQVRLVVQ